MLRSLRPPLPFHDLPWREQLHVAARQLSAPLRSVASAVPLGHVADVGCGHGLLTELLSQDPARRVLALDPDARKVALARRVLGARANVDLRVGTVEALAPELEGALDAVVVCDVLYLLPRAAWSRFFSVIRGLLRPGGRLILKEAEGNGSWKHWKCLAQEWVMVSLLKRTKSSGGMTLLPRGEMTSLLRAAGFTTAQVTSLDAGFTTPHVLYVVEKSAP